MLPLLFLLICTSCIAILNSPLRKNGNLGKWRITFMKYKLTGGVTLNVLVSAIEHVTLLSCHAIKCRPAFTFIQIYKGKKKTSFCCTNPPSAIYLLIFCPSIVLHITDVVIVLFKWLFACNIIITCDPCHYLVTCSYFAPFLSISWKYFPI